MNESAIGNLHSLKWELTCLQNSIFASKFNEILPRAQEQLAQKHDLDDILAILDEKKTYFEMKRLHFEFRLNETKNLLSDDILQ